MNTLLMRRMHHVRRIILHHSEFDFSGYGSIREVFEAIDSWHRKKWATGFGYHYLVGNGNGVPAGRLVMGRPWKYKGAHCRGNNSDSLGICVIGNFMKNPPKKEQIDKLVDFLTSFCAVHGLDPEGTYKKTGKPIISGHQDWNATDCPGSTFYPMLPSIRRWVATGVKNYFGPKRVLEV